MTGKELANEVLTDSAYKDLFKIETTTSREAKNHKNEELKKDEIHELINELRKMQKKKEIVRPRRIRIACSERTRLGGCWN